MKSSLTVLLLLLLAAVLLLTGSVSADSDADILLETVLSEAPEAERIDALILQLHFTV